MNTVTQRLSREVSIGKLQRDVANVREYARFVIVLGSSGPTVIDNGYRKEQGLPYARLIAVVGPVEHSGSIEEGILLEIGYRRTRPYAQVEEQIKGDKKWFMKGRPRLRELFDQEVVSVWPFIVECMTMIVLNRREHWANKGTWFIPGPGYVERGVYFTVSESDKLIHRQFMKEDITYRNRKYISGHTKRIRRFLGVYQQSYYTSAQLRNYARAKNIVDVLWQEHYTPLYRMALISNFPQGSHRRNTLDAIIEAFRVNVSLTKEEEEILEPSSKIVLPRFVNLTCCRHSVQPAVHAHGASVFEIMLERRYREQNEVPF